MRSGPGPANMTVEIPTALELAIRPYTFVIATGSCGLHYGSNPNWKMALRGTIFYILARHGFAYHGAVANRTIRKSAGADARLIENYDDAA
jgi:hypothetical protein